MRIARVALAMIIAGIAAWGAEQSREITVYLMDEPTLSPYLKAASQNLVSDIFARAKIRVVWRNQLPAQGLTASTFVVKFEHNTPDDLRPGALAFSQPYGDAPILIFLDRVKNSPEARSLLAHVMAHELAHVLQGISRHSATGIMKGNWTSEDLQNMRFKPLHFTQKDIELIHLGLDGRASRVPNAVAMSGGAGVNVSGIR